MRLSNHLVRRREQTPCSRMTGCPLLSSGPRERNESREDGPGTLSSSATNNGADLAQLARQMALLVGVEIEFIHGRTRARPRRRRAITAEGNGARVLQGLVGPRRQESDTEDLTH